MKASMSGIFFVFSLFTVIQAIDPWGALHNRTFANESSLLPSLNPTARFLHGNHATIKFSAYSGSAVLFVNGARKRKAGITPRIIRLFLIQNDVVAFKLKRFGELAGMMATIKWGERTYRTGVDRFTVREGHHGWEKWEKQAWNALVTYEDKKTGITHTFCHWDIASKTGTTTNKFDHEAFFISRLRGTHQNPAGSVFVRFVIGGEKCKSSIDEAETPKADSSEDLSGQSDDGSSSDFCACKLTEQRGGECYKMEDSLATSGRCTTRPCQPTFECAASSEQVCVRRRGGTKMVMVTPNVCKTVTADDMETLVPYEG
eukprot:gb/GEZJ01003382.1/.p1 GENE.gb/GEZJ01003382.1/~~gb/GEZJ01003382.1/.p1  ORF type:complete len:316 (-),score=28.72 gb/GEZJ01003382.1/:1800-2747(-)